MNATEGRRCAPIASPGRIALLISGQLARFAYRHSRIDACALPFPADAHIVLSRTAYSRLGEVVAPYPAELQLSDGALRSRVAAWFRERVGIRRVTLALLSAAELAARLHEVDEEVATAEPQLWQATAKLRRQAVLPSSGEPVVRWLRNGRMLYLRHAAFEASLRYEAESGLRYTHFLCLREDNVFLSAAPLPLAEHPLSQLPTGAFIAADAHCGFSGHPSDKIYFANRRGAEGLLGSTRRAHVRMLSAWLRYGLTRSGISGPSGLPQRRSVDPLQSESFLRHYLASKAKLLVWPFLRTDLQWAQPPGQAEPAACVRMLYYACAPKVLRQGAMLPACAPTTRRDLGVWKAHNWSRAVLLSAKPPAVELGAASAQRTFGAASRWGLLSASRPPQAARIRGTSPRAWAAIAPPAHRATAATPAPRALPLRAGAATGPQALGLGKLALECIGKGTYGCVLRASASGRPSEASRPPPSSFAIKVPQVQKHWGLKYFEAEYVALRRLSANGSAQHPNIIQLLGRTRVPLARLRGMPGSCLNQTELGLEARAHPQPGYTLPALALELLPDRSLYRTLGLIKASVRAGSKTPPPSFRGQEALFRGKLEQHRGDDVIRTITRAERGGNTAGLDVLLGLARALRRVHELGIIHRDLKQPGKNVMLRETGHGSLAAVLIDFSVAQVCPGEQGAAARAIEAYHFGNLLSYVCYGVAVDGIGLREVRCADSPAHRDVGRRALKGLAEEHARLHPNGRAKPMAGLLNRCHERTQRQFDALMTHCWSTALEAHARADLHRQGWPMRGLEFNWSKVTSALEEMRSTAVQDGIPLLRHSLLAPQGHAGHAASAAGAGAGARARETMRP